VSDQVLEVEALGLVRGAREVLRDVSFTLARGECLALVGRNGSGKSSLLRALSGLERPAQGRVRWLGRDALPEGRARVHVLGVMLQHEPAPSLTVGETLGLACASHDALARALAAHRLEPLAGRRVNELSGGERQRVALARASAGSPLLYLLDEPLNHLDLYERRAFASWLEHERPRAAMVIAAHDPALIALADRALFLEAGSARSASPQRVLADMGVSAAPYG
jgi:ABC-type multidrug transport system ATPase subunit